MIKSNYSEKILKNGAKLHLFKRVDAPIYVRFLFFSGSRFDTLSGTAHLLEHMLVAGSNKYPSKDLLTNEIESIGGMLGAASDNNFLKINIEVCHKDDLQVGLSVLNECFNPKFDLDIFEKEKFAVISEINTKKSNPKEYIWEKYRSLFFQNTNASFTTLGTVEDVEKIQIQDIISFFNTYIHSGRLSVIVSGDVSIDEISELVDKIVSLRSGNPIDINEPLPNNNLKKIEIENYTNLPQAQVMCGYRVNINNIQEEVALKILSSYIGEGRSSKLITRLRYQNGLVYSVLSSTFFAPDWSVFRVLFSSSYKNLFKVTQIINDEIINAKNYITEIELEQEKNTIIKGLIRKLQTSESWVSYHESSVFSIRGFNTVFDHINSIRSLDIVTFKKTLHKFFDDNQLLTALCGDSVEINKAQ